jgi:hypothetical protein
MMATTHALVGMAAGAVALALAPEVAGLTVVAGFLGGAFPDLDLYAGHRKTLHYPVYYPGVAVVLLGVAAAVPGAVTAAAAAFAVGAALHSAMDALGGGLELRPWRGTSKRAVYDHARGRWLRPRRWVRYDGAPEDLLLALAVGLPLLVTLDGVADTLVLGALAVSAVYAAVRKPMVALAERLFPAVPPAVAARVPDRFLELE